MSDKDHRLDEGEPDKEGERSHSAGDHQDHVDEQPRNKKPSERSYCFHFQRGPVVLHRPVDEDQVGGDDDDVAADDAGHVGVVVRHVVADGEDERLVVLRQDDRIVDQPAKFKDSEEGSDEPGKIQ